MLPVLQTSRGSTAVASCGCASSRQRVDPAHAGALKRSPEASSAVRRGPERGETLAERDGAGTGTASPTCTADQTRPSRVARGRLPAGPSTGASVNHHSTHVTVGEAAAWVIPGGVYRAVLEGCRQGAGWGPSTQCRAVTVRGPGQAAAQAAPPRKQLWGAHQKGTCMPPEIPQGAKPPARA